MGETTHSEEYDSKPDIAVEVSGTGLINNDRANLRASTEPWGRCGACVFWRKPNTCRIVEGPVKEDLTCDWIQRRGGPKNDDVKERIPADSDAFMEPRSLAWGLMKMQGKLALRVIDYDMTGAAPLLLMEDGQDPPNRFSVSLDRLIDTLGLDNGWTPEDIDDLIRLGKSMDFKPPINYEEASTLYGRGQLSDEEFEPFKRAREAKEMAPRPSK